MLTAYINIAIIAIALILFIALLITLATGAQKSESLYAPNVPLNMGTGKVLFVSSG